MTNQKKNRKRKRILRHLADVCMAVVSLTLMASPVSAIEPVEAANQVIGSEGGRKATKTLIDSALIAGRSKPAMTAATAIVCIACIPLAGAAASPGLCIACGILVVKTLG
jgi:hypothetical protein